MKQEGTGCEKDRSVQTWGGTAGVQGMNTKFHPGLIFGIQISFDMLPSGIFLELSWIMSKHNCFLWPEKYTFFMK
jgi:hypothetical protein